MAVAEKCAQKLKDKYREGEVLAQKAMVGERRLLVFSFNRLSSFSVGGGVLNCWVVRWSVCANIY